jgi:phage/plasmid-like protein (TIGR03299 family)
MAHELTIRADNKAEMAYVGTTPWHQLGQQLPEGADIPTWIQAARFDWSIQSSAVAYSTPEGLRTFDNQRVLHRSDTGEGLGIVSDMYKVVQPAEVLEFFSDLVVDNGFTLETAGTLFQGKRFWALARINESAKIISPKDVVGGYLLLSTSADGSTATDARFTTVRVVCNNTLSMAMQPGQLQGVKIGHRSTFNPAAVKDSLGVARGNFKEFISTARDLAKKRVSDLAAADMTLQLLAPGAGRGTDAARKVEASPAYTKILTLFDGAGKGAELAGVAGTAWGWLNAVTETVDYDLAAARTRKTVDHSLYQAWYGAGAGRKAAAVQLALSA